MCGIVGILSPDTSSLDQKIIHRMTGTLGHRGPDDTGTWIDEPSGLAMGHQRLAVLDLSRAGHQPMASACGRYVISFNGEIYNHQEIRKELELTDNNLQNNWRGHSDTETLITALSQWGVAETLHRCIGMFAIALWDRQDKKLYLARDRMGEKPLYYGWCKGALIFASELKAFLKFPGFKNTINRDVLALFLEYGHVPAPYSIYQNIYKLEPGCLLTLDIESAGNPQTNAPRAPANGKGFSLQRWWSLEQVALNNPSDVINDEQAALEQLEYRLRDTINLQSIADVPLGAFLSGGIDSSLIVALMQSQNNRSIKTFTIGFSEKGYDEAVHARAIAEHLGTDHTELYISASECMDVIPKLPGIYDEPFADSSQIPTILISRLARQHVTVALSGDAGDELFGGYNRYVWCTRIWSKIGWLPYAMRLALIKAMTILSTEQWDALYHVLISLYRSNKNINLFGDKLYKLADKLTNVHDLDDFYGSLTREWREPLQVVIGANSVDTLMTMKHQWPSFPDHESLMMYLDSVSYLPNDILCKVDRAAMNASLETRIPLLDHRLLELTWKLPLAMKIRNGQGKWALRQLLHKHMPKEIIDRPKHGFSIPLGEWLRGPLKNWVEDMIDPDRLTRQGYFHPAPVQQKWQEHLAGKCNWEHALWNVLMFQSWLDNQKNIS